MRGLITVVEKSVHEELGTDDENTGDETEHSKPKFSIQSTTGGSKANLFGHITVEIFGNLTVNYSYIHPEAVRHFRRIDADLSMFSTESTKCASSEDSAAFYFCARLPQCIPPSYKGYHHSNV